jgi:transaldolase
VITIEEIIMSDNPLGVLGSLGQSVWLDYIRRDLIIAGGLKKMIDSDGLKGMTSNPSIFDKAIAGSEDYDEIIIDLAAKGKTAMEIYDAISIQDVQLAANEFRPVYDHTGREDGFVSLEVSPELASDTDGTVDEGRRLWGRLGRPNVFIKVPATVEGLPAIRRLLADGVNVNVTLLFGLPRYRQVAEAYIAGLEDRLSAGLPIENVRSVASFFISRIDTLLDPMLEDIAEGQGPRASIAGDIQGQIAIDSAKIAYQMYKDIFSQDRFAKLTARGAHAQRLLWASTSTKNPQYSDIKYVEALIGPMTVNTLPMETLVAYRHHGRPELRLETGVDEANRHLVALGELGIDIAAATQQLVAEGVEKFVKPFRNLIETIARKMQAGQ